jgi:hypothetical protein
MRAALLALGETLIHSITVSLVFDNKDVAVCERGSGGRKKERTRQ